MKYKVQFYVMDFTTQTYVRKLKKRWSITIESKRTNIRVIKEIR